jgi:tripartite-type tricarboxylate transporter receptor subunit TctC
MDIVGGTPEEMDRFLRSEISRWATVVQQNKIRAGD